ncbi:outer dense fiber protein 3B [Pyrgilauda ruficollis]|uniref:outer dense fiber protein 3B n=1 Tax=Pyrgilauda ruficollis TaxID=221976 RepID=UPI001B8870C6|nr:outer dense fiber protein 3B [Pyrgilauda ruficollis]
MSNDFWVGPWRPHRLRGPTSAAYPSPGPKYRIASSTGKDQRDPSGRRAPAYSFGMKLGGPEEPRSPGPQYLVPAGFTARGRERGPAFTMGGRPRERQASNTPGPAYYSPEQANRVTLPSAPACSMRSRGRPDKPQQTPGPATYQLPPVVGPRLVNKTSTPQYIMTGRGPSIFDDNKQGPGDWDPRTQQIRHRGHQLVHGAGPPLHHSGADPLAPDLQHTQPQRLLPQAGPEKRTDLWCAPLGKRGPHDGLAPVGNWGHG